MAGRGSKAGVRRGRYRDGDGEAPAAAPPAPDVDGGTDLDELLRRLRDESPLKHPAAKELGVRVLGGLLREQQRLEGLSRSGGQLTGDEAKAVSANASNIRRWYEALGVVQHRDPEDDDGGL